MSDQPPLKLLKQSGVNQFPEKQKRHVDISGATNYNTSGKLLAAPANPRYLVNEDFWIETAPLQVAVEKYALDWQNLVDHAAEPNVFYEPWFLKIAHEHLAAHEQVEVVIVYHREKNPAEKPYLCGVFPLVYQRGWSFLPWIKIVSFWEHSFGYLNSPHLRDGYAMESVLCLMKWLTEVHPEVCLIELNRIPGEGVFAQTLQQVMHHYPITSYTVDSWNRALLKRDINSEFYLTKSTSTQRFRELKRKKRRLEETGRLELRELNDTAQLAKLIVAFLNLEQQGWKGEAKSAIAQNPLQKTFVENMLHVASDRKQLQFYGYFLDDQPIALKCNLIAGHGSFAWKIAYDESLQKYSPGVLLEMENVHLFHAQNQLEWMDSCAAPDHPMIDRIWKDRRSMRYMLLSTKHWQGHLALGIYQLMRSASRFWKRNKPFEITKHNF